MQTDANKSTETVCIDDDGAAAGDHSTTSVQSTHVQQSRHVTRRDVIAPRIPQTPWHIFLLTRCEVAPLRSRQSCSGHLVLCTSVETVLRPISYHTQNKCKNFTV